MLEHSQVGNLGNNLPQQLEAFWAELRRKEGVPSDVAPWPSEAASQPVANRICHSPPDDWCRIGRPLGGKGGWRTHRRDHVDVETDKVICGAAQSVQVPRPIFDDDILP